MTIHESCFDRLAAAYPNQQEHRTAWLQSWADLENGVVSRTVDWFLKNWARCPTLAEFKAETSKERDRMKIASRREQTDACSHCVSGWVVTDWEKWFAHPCEACRPEQHDRWLTGKYLPT